MLFLPENDVITRVFGPASLETPAGPDAPFLAPFRCWNGNRRSADGVRASQPAPHPELATVGIGNPSPAADPLSNYSAGASSFALLVLFLAGFAACFSGLDSPDAEALASAMIWSRRTPR